MSGKAGSNSHLADEWPIPPPEDPADVIAGLAKQAAPEGVSGDIWDKLTAELVRVLIDRGNTGKLASKAPGGLGGTIELSYIPASTSLQWLYASLGDYDQNGVVSVSDLTPLGIHFGETSSGGAGQPFDPLSELWVVDGDGNGVIDLGDITPIGANFGVTVEGYRVYYSEDEGDVPDSPDAANGPGATGQESISLWSANRYQGRLRFLHRIDPTLTPTHYWVRLYHGSDEGAASNNVTVSSAAPEAVLNADVTEGNAPLSVMFDASGSVDPDGFIARYDFDFDSNGTWDAYDAGSGIAHEYPDAGVYTALVRVTDNDFAQDTTTLAITVTVPGNEPPEADLSADVTDGDAPLHVYFDAQDSVDTDGEIVKYEWDFEGTGTYIATGNDPTIDYTFEIGYYTAQLRVTDDRGDTDTATLEIKARGWVYVDIAEGGGYPSLAVVGGNPAISCLGPDHELMFARSTTPDGRNPEDWQCTVVVPVNQMRLSSLAVIHGNPAIGYYDRAEEAVKYARALTPTGESAEDWQVVTAASGVGNEWESQYRLQLVEVAGRAAICYIDTNDQSLEYVRATTMSGTEPGDWEEPVVVDISDYPMWFCSMAEVNGNPAISYFDYETQSLMYARSTTSDGMSGADWQTVTVAVSVGEFVGSGASLAVVDGRPAISHGNADLHELRYARAESSTGIDGGWLITSASDYGSTNTCLCVVSGSPAICFINEFDLYYVRADNATGAGSGAWPPKMRVGGIAEGNIHEASMVDVSDQAAVFFRCSDGLKYAILY